MTFLKVIRGNAFVSFLALTALLGTGLMAAPARADVVVGVHAAHYGYVLVKGNPNPQVQSDTTFSLDDVTVGSRSSDSGTISAQPLNQKVRVRVGQYTITYSGTTSSLEVTLGQTTVVKLQKVTATPLENTVSVSLYSTDSLASDSDCSPLATFQRKTYDYSAYYRNQCSGWFCARNEHPASPDPIFHSWKEAYFYVLPGVYTMRWKLADGTTHEEDKINVQ